MPCWKSGSGRESISVYAPLSGPAATSFSTAGRKINFSWAILIGPLNEIRVAVLTPSFSVYSMRDSRPFFTSRRWSAFFSSPESITLTAFESNLTISVPATRFNWIEFDLNATLSKYPRMVPAAGLWQVPHTGGIEGLAAGAPAGAWAVAHPENATDSTRISLAFMLCILPGNEISECPVYTR